MGYTISLWKMQGLPDEYKVGNPRSKQWLWSQAIEKNQTIRQFASLVCYAISY